MTFFFSLFFRRAGLIGIHTGVLCALAGKEGELEDRWPRGDIKFDPLFSTRSLVVTTHTSSTARITCCPLVPPDNDRKPAHPPLPELLPSRLVRGASMFAFCVERFLMSESQANKRIRVARLARRFPAVIPMIHQGEVHLSGLCILASHLTDENHADVLQRAKGLSMRETEKLARQLQPL